MKSTRFWVVLFGVLLAVSVAASFAVHRGRPKGGVAVIYQDGAVIQAIHLEAVAEPYTFTVIGAVENTIAVEPGRIRVLSATCPDHVCVHQGWISGGVIPVVCLPNKLVIQIEHASDSGIDAMSQ